LRDQLEDQKQKAKTMMTPLTAINGGGRSSTNSSSCTTGLPANAGEVEKKAVADVDASAATSNVDGNNAPRPTSSGSSSSVGNCCGDNRPNALSGYDPFAGMRGAHKVKQLAKRSVSERECVCVCGVTAHYHVIRNELRHTRDNVHPMLCEPFEKKSLTHGKYQNIISRFISFLL
jgi:hypothetical protein